MQPAPDMFDRSIMRQIEVNQARSPTERFLALCDLLDAIRAMAPQDAAAQERRRRALAARQQFRRFLARQPAPSPPPPRPAQKRRIHAPLAPLQADNHPVD